MQKMLLERFKEIRDKTREFAELIAKVEKDEIIITEEEGEKISEELQELNDEIHSSDLSEIPYEEYEGFYDIGFDFQGTNANLDFQIINASFVSDSIAKLKGCNIRNFDFNNQKYDDNSFDEDFKKEHIDKFLNKDLPDDVKRRYYLKYLSVEDIIQYELYDYAVSERASKETREFFEKIPIEVVKTIDVQIYTSNELGYWFRSKLNEFDGEITKEVIENLTKETIEEYLNRQYLLVEKYNEVINIPKVREVMPDNVIIDFGENDELAGKYLNKHLEIEDVILNLDIFRKKKFITSLDDYRYNPNKYDEITEEKLYYLFDNYPDISKVVSSKQEDLLNMVRKVNPELEKEENLKEIQSLIVDLLSKEEELDFETRKLLERYYSLEALTDKLDEYDKHCLEKIMEYTTKDKIEGYGITARILQNSSVLFLLSRYGLETVMEFDKENGNIFSKNDFELAKKMDTYYFHYGSNQNDPNKSIYYRLHATDNYSEPFQMEDFEEVVRRMIVEGPSDWNYSKEQPIDFRDFSDRFKEKFPRMFLEETAPEELKEKFYTKTLKIEDLGNNPDWIEFLDNKDYEVGMQLPNVAFRSHTSYESYSLIQFAKMLDTSEVNILKILNDNAKTIKMLEMYFNSTSNDMMIQIEDIHNLDDFRNTIEIEVENKILSGILEYGEPYIPEFFKEKHPDLILDETAPEELKAKFYSLYYDEYGEKNKANNYRFTVEDLTNEEYKPFLKGKTFELVRDADQVKNITKIFDIDTIGDLYNIDPSAFEIYCFNLENANILKEVLDIYPEKYAREELMSGLKLSSDNFEDKILNDEEFKTKFASLKRAYIEDFVKSPGFVLALDPEKHSRETLKQYKALSSSNVLNASNRYSRDSYEQILGNMLGFLGYDEARKLLEIPQIDEDTLDRIYQQDEIIKSLYEKKFEIIGNLKVVGKLLENVPALLPTAEKITSKETCKVFMSINKRIQEGYKLDITSLLSDALAENGIEVDKEKVNQLVQDIVETSTLQKLDLVKENNSVVIDTNIDENQKTKNMIKMHYRNALEYSLNQSEKINPELVREYLEGEFARVKDDGQPYYSSHVTEHLEEMVKFSEELTSNPEWNKKLNHSIVDDLKEESERIGKGWIRKITSNICLKPEKLTYEEAERLDELIYPEESGLEIETKATIGLKKLNEEEKAKIYELLNNEQFRGLFTYGKAENMFSTLRPPYSEKFKEFFLKYKDDFIGNPDLYAKFPVMASKFESYIDEPGFNTRFEEGTLTPEDVLLKLSSEAYPNLVIDKGENELVYQAKNAGLTEEQVKIAIKLLKDMKERERQAVPQEEFETRRFKGRIVRMDDPIHFTIGEITNCCQTIGKGQPGETSMIHSATEKNGALFIVEEIDETGKPIGIVSQSWTWRHGNKVCFDNVEIPHKVEEQLKQIGGFDEIMDVYQEVAKRMIETDKIKLRRLVEKGKITEEELEKMVIKDVSMGLGCDNLVVNLSEEKRRMFPAVSAGNPAEIGKTYTGAGSRTLYTDSKQAVLIAHNDDFDKEDHVHAMSEKEILESQYIKQRDIFRRKGLDIDSDKIELISKMVQKSNRESIFQNSPINISEMLLNLGIKDLGMADIDKIKMSMSESGDWYILMEEMESGIMIHETGIDLSEANTSMDTLDRKMALGEYTREMYKIMLEAGAKGKSITIDEFSKNKLFDLDILIKEGIISTDDIAITVNDTQKLAQKVEAYNQALDKQRRKRLVTDFIEEAER